jgi:hypothetical protein
LGFDAMSGTIATGYQTLHMQLNKPNKNLFLKKINTIIICCLKKEGTRKTNNKAKTSNTEGNYETLIIFFNMHSK